MSINITGQNIELTEALQDYATKRFTGLLRRAKKEDDRIDLVLSVTGDRCKVSASARLGVSKHDVLAEGDDMYAVIDAANHKLHRVVEDGHDTKVENRRRGGPNPPD